MKKAYRSLILGLTIGLILTFLIVNIVFATIINIQPPWGPDGPENIRELIQAIAVFIFQLALIVAPIMFIYAGFLFITSSGEQEKVRKAKNAFTYTLIGLVIVLAANGLVLVIESVFTQQP